MNIWTKLRDGWGVRVTGTVAVGDTVTVHRRDGSSSKETVTAIVSQANDRDDSTVCRVAEKSRQPAPTNQQRFSRHNRRRRDEDESCELCGKNKYTCGHCIGW
jgi:hypothetical protein